MRLTRCFLIAQVVYEALGFGGLCEATDVSFLQATRFNAGVAKIARAAAREVEGYQLHRRPQRRMAPESAIRHKGPTEYPKHFGAYRAYNVEGVVPAQKAHQPREQVITGAALHNQHGILTPPETPTKELKADEAPRGENELSAAASKLGGRRRAPEQATSLEESISVSAMQFLALPQLEKRDVRAADIVLAKVSSLGMAQLQLFQVTESFKHFVEKTPQVAVFEMQATSFPFAAIIPALHHLRVGFGTLDKQAADSPAAVLKAAGVGRNGVETTFKVLNKIMQLGYPSTDDAIETTALLLPIYSVDVSSFNQKYAWVGNTVFSPVAAITPAYECTFEGIIANTPKTASILGSSQEMASTTAYLQPLSVQSRERVALRILLAVCNLHSVGLVHGNITTQSIVVSASGNIYLSNLESSKAADDVEPCQLSASQTPPVVSSPVKDDLHGQPESASGSQASTEAPMNSVHIRQAVTPEQPAATSTNSPDGLCIIGSERIQQKIADESFQLGAILFQVLSEGSVPMTIKRASDEVPDESRHELPGNEHVPNVEGLAKLGISENWQKAVDSLVGNSRLTALQVRATYFPEGGSG